LVGLGEATHGTSEFFRMKHRMLEFLVKEMGFTSFYMETSMSSCHYISDYVLFGIGDLDSATVLTGIWKGEEVKNMIKWMRQYNASVPDENKIKFFGIDLQSNDHAWKELKDFYGKVNAKKLIGLDSLKKQTDAGLPLVGIAQLTGQKNEGEKLLKDAYPKALAVMDDIVLNEGKYEFLTDKYTYKENLMNVKLIVECLETYQAIVTAFMVRDYYMVENILNLLNQEKPNAKAVVWAHNGHIAKDSSWVEPLGYKLANIFKAQYYAIGFEFYSGSFKARNREKSNKYEIMSVGVPPVESLPWYFDQTGKEKFFIDFRKTGIEKIKNFTQPYGMHSFGAGYSTKRSITTPSFLTDYDGMIYIKESTGTKNISNAVIEK
jgi:erythromycin esterase